MSELTKEQIEFFHENGYLVIKDYFPAHATAEMRNRMDTILDEMDTSVSKTVFSTGENQTDNADNYFLESSDKISYFWEKDAWKEVIKTNPTTGEIERTSECTKPIKESINKVGHALHDLDPVFKKYSYDIRNGKILRDLGMKVPTIAQSMYIFKQPHIGGDVCAHQDGSYLYTDPQSVIGMWWSLDRCTVNNGCLWAVPGSHKHGVLRQYRRKENIDSIAGGGKTEYYPVEPEKFDLSQGVPLEIDENCLVLIHHAVVHYSEKNTSANPRHAYSIHVIDGAEGIEYSKRNWLQRPPSMPFKTIPYE